MAEAFIKKRKSILSKLTEGSLSALEYLILDVLLLKSDPLTGVWRGNVPLLLETMGGSISLDSARKSLKGLHEKGFIKTFHVQGNTKAYAVVIDNYEIPFGPAKGKRIDADHTLDWRNPAYRVASGFPVEDLGERDGEQASEEQVKRKWSASEHPSTHMPAVADEPLDSRLENKNESNKKKEEIERNDSPESNDIALLSDASHGLATALEQLSSPAGRLARRMAELLGDVENSNSSPEKVRRLKMEVASYLRKASLLFPKHSYEELSSLLDWVMTDAWWSSVIRKADHPMALFAAKVDKISQRREATLLGAGRRKQDLSTKATAQGKSQDKRDFDESLWGNVNRITTHD